MEKQDFNTDEEKRGKLLLLAGLISLVIFLGKVLPINTGDSSTLRIYLDAGVYFLIVVVGLVWAFNFQIKLKSFMYILQSALFVFSEALFIEFFFFQKFNRIYEALILLILVILVFAGNYASFLTANVFNVDLFKKIPLVQVGRTTSYVISLLMIYFFTFSFLASGFPIYILIPMILVLYLFTILVHYENIGIEKGSLFRKALLTLLVTFFLFLGVFLTGNTHELTSLIPALGYFFCVGAVTQENLVKKNDLTIILSLIFVATIFFVSILLNIAS